MGETTSNRGRLRRRLVRLLAALLVVFAQHHGVSAQTRTKPVVVLQGSDLESLNPQWHNTTSNHAIWRHIIEPLVEYDFNKRRYVGVLAESWTAKGTEWIFKLRRNIKFHSGTDLTAADIVYTFKRSTDSKLVARTNCGAWSSRFKLLTHTPYPLQPKNLWSLFWSTSIISPS